MSSKLTEIIIDGDNGKQTLKRYLMDLLITLWVEGESFSGKRPFGNSGWQWDVYKSLIENKIIDGKLDKYGYIEKINELEACDKVTELIEEIFK